MIVVNGYKGMIPGRNERLVSLPLKVSESEKLNQRERERE